METKIWQCTLYSKEIPVARLTYDGIRILKVLEIQNHELLPIMLMNKNVCTPEAFTVWMNKRGMPQDRCGIKKVRLNFGNNWETGRNCRFGLSDQYWFKYSLREKWDKMNFFTNRYSEDIGKMFFEPWNIEDRKKICVNSPDITTNGYLKKRWVQNLDMTSSLIKGGDIRLQQFPLNEVIASEIAFRLGIISVVRYSLVIDGLELCSRCNNFITPQTELVPALHIYNTKQRPDNISPYRHLLSMCDLYRIPEAKEFIDGMLVIDYLTGNEDRNLSNFGFIRDVKTGIILGPAPLYDFGNAYMHPKKMDALRTHSNLFPEEVKIFNKMKTKIDFTKLQGMTAFDGIIRNYPFFNDERSEKLIKVLHTRTNALCQNSTRDEIESFIR